MSFEMSTSYATLTDIYIYIWIRLGATDRYIWIFSSYKSVNLLSIDMLLRDMRSVDREGSHLSKWSPYETKTTTVTMTQTSQYNGFVDSEWKPVVCKLKGHRFLQTQLQNLSLAGN